MHSVYIYCAFVYVEYWCGGWKAARQHGYVQYIDRLATSPRVPFKMTHANSESVVQV